MDAFDYIVMFAVLVIGIDVLILGLVYLILGHADEGILSVYPLNDGYRVIYVDVSKGATYVVTQDSKGYVVASNKVS